MSVGGTRRAILNVGSFVILMAILYWGCQADNDSPPTIESRTVDPTDPTYDPADP